MILHGDFRDALSSGLLASLHAAALITDPPYSANVHANATSARTGGRGAVKRDLGFEHLSAPDRGLICDVAALVSRWSIIFSDLESTHLWRADMAARRVEYVREVAHAPDAPAESDPLPARWIRWTQPQLSGDRPVQGCEAVLTFHATAKGKPVRKAWNGPGGLMALQHRGLRGADKHGAEKPLDEMLAIVSYFSDQGETVIDTCGGAGTTALACRLLDRDCVCFERDERWADWADVRERSPLCARDQARALEWVQSVRDEVARVGYTEDDGPAYARAMRRLADAQLAETAAKDAHASGKAEK